MCVLPGSTSPSLGRVQAYFERKKAEAQRAQQELGQQQQQQQQQQQTHPPIQQIAPPQQQMQMQMQLQPPPAQQMQQTQPPPPPMQQPQAQRKEWLYLDDDAQPQGPFTLADMLGWNADGFFVPTLKVKHINDANYVDLQSCRALNPPQMAGQPAVPSGNPGMHLLGGGGGQHKMRGKVKNWQDMKGFGFIIPDPECGLGEELFVHRSEIIADPNMPGARPSLAPEQEVLFEVGPGRNGAKAAKNVTLANGQPVSAPRNDSMPPDIARLMNDRMAARRQKDFDAADSIRDELMRQGYM
eukprot:COSAG02_NODE_19203_length_894_cov_6.314199_1_plen_297_part_11